ncbi:hypothetical protein [Caenimonas aquaedulcis]|uniref:Uncharacterized protein n=1 Tax=Caenimonas aquaedulcis TaxID=2793270 RepID=A0A931H5M4_9BURK|nr:hypothetical protein [Caenimonas aquaedulcis]MBG9388993.1 hypothetical protein [Caenimonas aquaedulcis]
MPLLSWLFPAKKHRAKPAPPESSGLSRMEATRPARRNGREPSVPMNNAQPANRKNERMARRELLYNVVRASMTRAGVLSSSYKFKVLSLDGRGRQFLVMVDLSRDQAAGEISKLAEIEALIAQGAKSRHDILVTAVYWRTNEHVAIGDPVHAGNVSDSHPMPLESMPAALDSAPAPLAPEPAMQPVAAPLQRGGARYEAIQADEVAAFKQALAEGISRPAALAAAGPAAASHGAGHGASAKAFDGSSKHGPQSYTLLTGFEDTELPDADMRAQALSGTQYGELR